MNTMKLEFVSRLENEAFARTSAVAFLMPLNLDMEAIMEIIRKGLHDRHPHAASLHMLFTRI